MVLYDHMNNIYTNIIAGAILAIISMMPSIGEAYSYTYNPSSNGINIVNDNYNNNINTNDAPVSYLSASYIAQSNLPTHFYSYSNYSYPISSYTHPQGCGRCISVVEVGGVEMPKPFCTLVPAITDSGEVQLQWTIKRATVAYIDSGIGHIAPTSGSIIVNPTKDTTYNLTALNDAGIASSCVAKVNVTIDNTDPIDNGGDGNNGGNNGNDNNGGSLFGDTFRAIALPIGVAFLILIILLIVIMSKVKNSH